MQKQIGGASVKTIIIMVILVLVGILGVLGVNTVRTMVGSAAAGVEPKNVLAKSGEDGRSGVVSWATDKPCMAVVEYGTTPASLLLRSVENESVADHRVSLTPLKAGVNYYFRIRVGEEIYDNNGIPFSFKTKESEVALEPSPTVVVPTVATVSPTVAGETSSCDRQTDYNFDGRVNSLDYLECMKAPTGMAGKTETADKCDANKDGRVSSVERLNCK